MKLNILGKCRTIDLQGHPDAVNLIPRSRWTNCEWLNYSSGRELKLVNKKIGLCSRREKEGCLEAS